MAVHAQNFCASLTVFVGMQSVLNAGRYDEVIISTLPRRLHVDLPRKVAGLGLPVEAVEAKELALATEE